MHDKDTGRTAAKNLNIEESLSAEISKVKLRNNEAIPILDDVLDLVAGRVGINIEIKSDGAGAVLSRQLFHYRYSGYIMVSSFKEREVLDAREVMLDLPVSGIFDTFVPAEVSNYRSRGYGFISLRKKTVTRELVRACHDQKIKVYVWTVDEVDEIKRFIEWGVDGMYSNKPTVLKKVVDGLS
jgi:glycerophosphoryl diester phosphodiesterase